MIMMKEDVRRMRSVRRYCTKRQVAHIYEKREYTCSMLSKKYLALIVVAVLAVGVGVVVTWGYVHKDADGYYDYDIGYADSFENGDTTIVAPTGKTFAIVEIVIKNVNYDGGIPTSITQMPWQLTVDRLTFEPSPVYTLEHPDYPDGMKINKGRTWGYTIVFEIPQESAGKRDASLDYRYVTLGDGIDLRYDPELRLNTF